MLSSVAWRKLIVSLALSMVGGYVDVICFVRYNTFVATMTGNLVITGQTFFEVLHAPLKFTKALPGAINAHVSPHVALVLVIFRSSVMLFNCVGALGYCALQRRVPMGTARFAAPWIALLSLMPDIVLAVGHDHEGAVSMCSVATLAFALGFTHFMCSPAAEGSRLKGVTMAATGHMHGMTKANHRLLCGESLAQADWDKYAVSMTITLGMTLGAILGAAALHLNPFSEDTNDWVLVPVGITLFCSLHAHDATIPPPGGWPELRKRMDGAATADLSDRMKTLTEPLTGAAAAAP